MIMRTALFLMVCMSIGALLLSALTLVEIHRYHGSADTIEMTLNQQISNLYQQDFITEIDKLQKTLSNKLPIAAATATHAAFTPIIAELIEEESIVEELIAEELIAEELIEKVSQ